jgi:hypothetical protein
VLIFREGTQREQERVQAALRAAVAGRWADPAKVWPEYFGKPAADEDAFPETGADMSGFRWEQPDEQRIAAELEQMMHGARVTLTDGVAAAPPPREQEAALRPMTSRMGPNDASELEWG